MDINLDEIFSYNKNLLNGIYNNVLNNYNKFINIISYYLSQESTDSIEMNKICRYYIYFNTNSIYKLSCTQEQLKLSIEYLLNEYITNYLDEDKIYAILSDQIDLIFIYEDIKEKTQILFTLYLFLQKNKRYIDIELYDSSDDTILVICCDNNNKNICIINKNYKNIEFSKYLY